MENEPLIRVAEICRETSALGPGLRSVLWVQGCLLRCQGCIAQEWLPLTAGHELSIGEVADRLLANPAVQGITISGGEPTLQAQALTQLLKLVRSRRELHVICFSGYLYESLLLRPESSKIPGFLTEIDLLIDGPYVQELNQNDTFAGSRNQRMIRLSERPIPGVGPWEFRKMELRLREGSILAVGVPPQGWKREIFQKAAALQPRVSKEAS